MAPANSSGSSLVPHPRAGGAYGLAKRWFRRLAPEARAYPFDLKHLRGVKRVLELPAGSGWFLAALKQAQVAAIGVDLNPRAVAACRARGLEAVEASVFALPFEAGAFDAIHCAHLIEHFLPADLVRLLTELDRVLAPGGILILRAPLPSRVFYNEVSHIRPYPPSSLEVLLNVTGGGDSTLETSAFAYDFVDLAQWGGAWFQPLHEVSVAPGRFALTTVLKSVGLALAALGVRTWERREFSLVLRKRAR